MHDLFNDFFTFGFGDPIDLKFNVGGTKDIMPACWSSIKDKEGNVEGYKATCRTVGIDEQDVKVKISDKGIVVEGKTEYEGVNYDTHYEIPISKGVMDNAKSIDYKTLNGLTYIYIYVEKPEKKKIKINKI